MKIKRLWTSSVLWTALAGLALWAFVFCLTVSQVGAPFPGFRLGYCAVVSDFNEPNWNGLRAGLRAGDQLAGVDGHPVASARAVLDHVRALPVGTPVRYEVVRGAEVLSISVPTQKLGLLSFLSSCGGFFFIGFLMLLIAAAAALLKPESRPARDNLWLSGGLALSFAFANEYDLVQALHPSLYYSANLLYASAALSMAFHFPYTPWYLLKWPRLRYLPYAIGALLTAVTVRAFQVHGASPVAEGIANGLSMLWPTLVLVVALALFGVRLKTTRDVRQSNQIKVLLLGIAVAYLPVVFLDMLPRMLTGQPPLPLLTNLSYASRLFFPLALAYAIVKHQLFDISLIIKRTTTYAVLTAFLVGGYFATAAAVRTVATALLGGAHGGDWENVLATAVIAVAFMPVRQAVTARVDKLFSRTKYDFVELVARVTEKAQTSLEINEMKGQFLQLVGEALKPQYIYILTMRPEGETLATMGMQATWGKVPFPDLTVYADDPLLANLGKASEMHYVPATGATGQLSQLAALGPHYRVPLQVGEEVVGCVILGPKASDQDYFPEDRKLLAALRLPLANAIKTAAMVDDKLFKDRIEQELKRAREVQEAMLPRSLPELPHFEFAATMTACYEASGDYYDFVELPDGRLGIAVADVAGKGIAAAMATAMAKSGLYNQTQLDPEVIPVLTALNRLLHAVSKNAAAKSFTTCLYALLDPAERRLTFSCAGHFPPLHYDAAGDRISDFPLKGGFPLGVREKSRYTASSFALSPGDVVVLYTDGVTEAQAPAVPVPGSGAEPDEPFESDRLTQVLLAHKHQSAREIHDAIQAAVADFVAGGPQTDDITIVVLKVREDAAAADEAVPESFVEAPALEASVPAAEVPASGVPSSAPVADLD